jgi:aminopeptidase N/puromycin-sensitive aminopeptidase
MLVYFNRYFETDYPFGKLDILAISDFAAGAMENTAAIFGREVMLLADESATAPPRLQGIASVISHEIVHHWFGDLVTPRWWDDIWLNEGFATWMEMKPVHEWRPEWRMPGEDVRISRTSIGTDGSGRNRRSL